MSLLNLNTNYGLHKKCVNKKAVMPSIIPEIFNLSTNTSIVGKYQVVTITGQNFRYNNTRIKFGTLTNIEITYNSSFNISFVVPGDLIPGTYTVYVTTINNNNTIPNILYSNASIYILT